MMRDCSLFFSSVSSHSILVPLDVDKPGFGLLPCFAYLAPKTKVNLKLASRHIFVFMQLGLSLALLLV